MQSMSHEVVRNIREAKLLCNEVIGEELNHGCVDVSLRALGAPAHLVDILKGNETQTTDLIELLLRRGLKPQWEFIFDAATTGMDVENLLEGRVPDISFRSRTGLVGFLCRATYSDEPESGINGNHVMAILPRHQLSRDRRRKLKAEKAYMVIDSNTEGVTLQVSANKLAEYAQDVMALGGTFSIIELHR